MNKRQNRPNTRKTLTLNKSETFEEMEEVPSELHSDKESLDEFTSFVVAEENKQAVSKFTVKNEEAQDSESDISDEPEVASELDSPIDGRKIMYRNGS